MKRSLLVAVFSVWVVCGAQNDWRFADSSAQWNTLWVNEWNFPPPGIWNTYVVTVKGDTTIKGQKYQNLSDAIFFRRDSFNRVYQINQEDTNEFLIYDFGSQVGDTIEGLGPSAWRVAIVDSIDSVFIGHFRKRVYTNYGDEWIDGIGTLYWPLLYEPVHFPETWGILLCYFENGQQFYHDLDYGDTCEININVGINEMVIGSIKLSPNPATTSLTIQTEELTAPAVFQLLDVTGRMVLQQPLTDKTTRIDVSAVSKGMYLYSVVSEKQKAGAGKLIIE